MSNKTNDIIISKSADNKTVVSKIKNTNHIIEIKNLTKKFGDFTAVDKMNLNIQEGEIFGFLGPNGAGKTTTISMLTTLIQPTSGTASIAGHDLFTEDVDVRSIIGVVPQSFSLFSELTAQENLEYIGKLYGMSNDHIRKRSEYLLRQVSLYEHRDRIAGVFSGGMKQRLSLAASIMSNPKILFMDEPTTGLDPQSRIAIRELTEQLNSEGMTIIYTTHDMEEADKICDRIVIMDKGRIISDGTSDQLKHSIMSGHLIEVRLGLEEKGRIRDIIPELKKLPFIKSVEYTKDVINITVNTKTGTFYRISDFFHKREIIIEEIQYKEPSLEDVFIHLTKKELRD
jgi:ABC-2 type transport system ATP-binding protein